MLPVLQAQAARRWHELFHPRRHVAIDLAEHEDSPYFVRWLEQSGARASVETLWRTDQADSHRLRELVATYFDGPLDLVVDDCSHLHRPTRASFETLFPLLRPGGLYIVEDWAWSHWEEFQGQGHPWANEEPLTSLVLELVEAAGTSRDAVASVTVYEGFAAVERGSASGTDLAGFDVDRSIRRRPQDVSRSCPKGRTGSPSAP